MGTFDPGFIEAYATSTGEKHTIPEVWLDDPVLGKNFAKTPVQKAHEQATSSGDLPTGMPTEKWTIAQLTQYAVRHDIDVTDAKVKADYLTAINTHAAVHSGAEHGTITPDAGDEE